jgi:hypothetical protein
VAEATALTVEATGSGERSSALAERALMIRFEEWQASAPGTGDGHGVCIQKLTTDPVVVELEGEGQPAYWRRGILEAPLRGVGVRMVNFGPAELRPTKTGIREGAADLRSAGAT